MFDIRELIDKDLLNPKKLLELWLQLREEKKFWNLFEQYKGAKKALTEEEENALREDFYKVMSGQPLTPGPGRPKAGQKRKVQPKKKAQNGYKRTILLNGQPLEYILKRSTRKTIGLVISDGVLTVKAPHYEPILWIEKVIEGHSAWIEKNLGKTLNKKYERIREPWLSAWENKCIKVVGLQEPVRIEISAKKERKSFDESTNTFYFFSTEEVDQAIFYKAALEFVKYWARIYLTDLTHKTAEKDAYFIERLKKVKLSSAETRWGSCSCLGNVNLNWRLVLTEESLCEYVIIHELCHLYYLDHSPSFWNKVLEKCPDAMERRAKLRTFHICDPVK